LSKSNNVVVDNIIDHVAYGLFVMLSLNEKKNCMKEITTDSYKLYETND